MPQAYGETGSKETVAALPAAHPARLGIAARHHDRAALRRALADSRERLRALVFGLTDAQWHVPYRRGINPPAWEAAHVAWFHEVWTLRAPHRVGEDGFVYASRPPVNAGPDEILDSARLAHADRWTLPDIGRAGLAAMLDAQHAACLEALDRRDDSDEALYFHRLGLFHEDMHNEAFTWYRATLGLPAPAGAERARFTPRAPIRLGPARVRIGADPSGFAFDNESPAHEVDLPGFEIDATPVSAGDFARFVEAGGYANPAYWPADAGRWRAEAARAAPERWRRTPSGWEERWFDRWQPLDAAAPVIHVNAYEAEAYCRWAGRRLPRAAEWEHAASAGAIVDWGRSVWEWTADAFAPYAGFARGPYRDYSAPWFGDHREARGGAFAADARMHHPRYRNFFMPARSDVFVGFRTARSL